MGMMGLAPSTSRHSGSNRGSIKGDQNEDDAWSQLPPLPEVTPTQYDSNFCFPPKYHLVWRASPFTREEGAGPPD